MPNMTLDHVSLLVRSLEASSKFYTGVLGFVPIHNGTEKPNIRWFGIGGITALHITEEDFGDTRRAACARDNTRGVESGESAKCRPTRIGDIG